MLNSFSLHWCHEFIFNIFIYGLFFLPPTGLPLYWIIVIFILYISILLISAIIFLTLPFFLPQLFSFLSCQIQLLEILEITANQSFKVDITQLSSLVFHFPSFVRDKSFLCLPTTSPCNLACYLLLFLKVRMFFDQRKSFGPTMPQDSYGKKVGDERR